MPLQQKIPKWSTGASNVVDLGSPRGFGVKDTHPRLVFRQEKVLTPLFSEMTSQHYDPPPTKPKENTLSVERSCYCLKPKELPVRTVVLMQKFINTMCTV